MTPILVGLADSGCDAALAPHVAASAGFRAGPGGTVEHVEAGPDRAGHGTALAEIVLSGAPAARLLVAQIFADRSGTSADVAAAGLDWLVAEGADIVVLSFGLREDRPPLREAVAAAVARGTILLAASPARGAPVHPAAYPGVIRVTGDARCAPGEVSVLATAQADFGACVTALPPREAAGASFAVPHLAGIVADHLMRDGDRAPAAVCRHLAAVAAHRGPERRGAAGR